MATNFYKQKGNRMEYKRASGIILHPTSLPGPYGIGDLGAGAYHWLKFLKKSGCGLWQILPLGPTGYGDSPYQCFSAFAGNFYLISPELLLKEGLLTLQDIADLPEFPPDHVDYGWVIPWKTNLLDRAYDRFIELSNPVLANEYAGFRQQNAHWLEDFALFMALKEAHNGLPWPGWEPAIRSRHPDAIKQAQQNHAIAIERQVFRQFIFHRQWSALRQAAHSLGITIIGDAPIFVAHDSADVWANPDLFFLDPQGNPTVVAGVPPDYFSSTGQLWGNPLYRWPVHKSTGYAWWISRLKSVLSTVDIIRLDHFRGFAGYWEVPAGLPTAEKGRWVPGPGADFFQAVQAALGDLPLIAEDLGEITPDVVELRDRFKLPGMKILQFAFASDATDKFLPHNYTQNFVVYTGTHDNDTTLGWFRNVPKSEVRNALQYLGLSSRGAEKRFSWTMLRALWGSVAMFALAPLQDFLNLGAEARMNYPGRASGNWTWRMPEDALKPGLLRLIKALNSTYGRIHQP
jgi:4-alpha-glucanotransferase